MDSRITTGIGKAVKMASAHNTRLSPASEQAAPHMLLNFGDSLVTGVLNMLRLWTENKIVSLQKKKGSKVFKNQIVKNELK